MGLWVEPGRPANIDLVLESFTLVVLLDKFSKFDDNLAGLGRQEDRRVRWVRWDMIGARKQ